MTDLDRLSAEVAGMRTDLNAYGQGLHALAEAVQVNNDKLDLVLEALTKEPGPSPIEDLLREIVRHLQEQAPVIQRIAEAVQRRQNGATP